MYKALIGMIAQKDELISKLANRIDELKKELTKFSICKVIHLGYPEGFTCIDKLEYTKTNPKNYTDDFRKQLINGVHLCSACKVYRVLNK